MILSIQSQQSKKDSCFELLLHTRSSIPVSCIKCQQICHLVFRHFLPSTQQSVQGQTFLLWGLRRDGQRRLWCSFFTGKEEILEVVTKKETLYCTYWDLIFFSQIVLCQNNIHQQSHMTRVVTHELIHAFDHCRAHVDWFNNYRHLACSEVRCLWCYFFFFSFFFLHNSFTTIFFQKNKGFYSALF